MSSSDISSYSRQDLRKASRFVEGDYRGINPREFYRRLKRTLEEIQTGDGFKYTTSGSQNADLAIISESVGEKTGRLEGRLTAEADWEILGPGTVEYRPWGPLGALLIGVSAFLIVSGAVIESTLALVLGVLGALGGIYAYMQTEEGTFPIAQKDILRVLMTGEVSERTIEGADERRTDIFANMSVIYAGDSFVRVYTEADTDPETPLEDLPLALRVALVRQVRTWRNRVLSGPAAQNGNEFVAYLLCWGQLNPITTRNQIDQIQAAITSSLDSRLAYSELLYEQLPPTTRQVIEERQENIHRELEELAADMDVYVEREGLEHTSL